MIMLMSGGMDSIAQWRLLGMPPAVHMMLGTVATEGYNSPESKVIDWAEYKFGRPILRRELPMGAHEAANGYVPYRNSLLILAAAQLDPEVCIAQVAEWCPDKNKRFYRALEKAANFSGSLAGMDDKLRVAAPFANLSKGELLLTYLKKFGTQEAADLIAHTWSCYRNRHVHCGECGSCVQRFNAICRAFGRPIQPFAVTPQAISIPRRDYARWIRDNGWDGITQIKTHNKDVEAGLKYVTEQAKGRLGMV